MLKQMKSGFHVLAILLLCVLLCGCNTADTAIDKESDMQCTISINCANALAHSAELPEALVERLPADGVILEPATVALQNGDSVFTVLQRVTREENLHMEYVDTPLYNSAYIEGIANLYEFDCGEHSGWMYSVNGQFPNYGCSSCMVNDGDVIQWVYTCDLGNDVGNDNGTQR